MNSSSWEFILDPKEHPTNRVLNVVSNYGKKEEEDFIKTIKKYEKTRFKAWKYLCIEQRYEFEAINGHLLDYVEDHIKFYTVSRLDNFSSSEFKKFQIGLFRIMTFLNTQNGIREPYSIGVFIEDSKYFYFHSFKFYHTGKRDIYDNLITYAKCKVFVFKKPEENIMFDLIQKMNGDRPIMYI